MRLLALILAATFLSGCFVFDELDKSESLLGHYGSASKNKEPVEEAPPPSRRSSDAGTVKKTWAKVKRWGKRQLEPDRPPPHPDNVVVRCVRNGKTHYTRRFDCKTDGGRVTGIMRDGPAS